MFFTLHHIALHLRHITSCHVTLHHVMSYYIMSRHITFIYMYLYLIWEQFLFFHTKLIVQAYGQLGHRVQDSASTLDSLTSSEVDKVIAQLYVSYFTL